MRWGVRDDAADDHITTALCMEEIENCKRTSVGLNFVVSGYYQFIGKGRWRIQALLLLMA